MRWLQSSSTIANRRRCHRPAGAPPGYGQRWNYTTRMMTSPLNQLSIRPINGLPYTAASSRGRTLFLSLTTNCIEAPEKGYCRRGTIDWKGKEYIGRVISFLLPSLDLFTHFFSSSCFFSTSDLARGRFLTAERSTERWEELNR